jgi:SAM-dependent methyltransferase
MVKSKGWDWTIVKDDPNSIWKNPSIESFYLLNRWQSLNFKNFLDLGCGLGRHTILFAKNNFKVSCFDISEEAIKRTKSWCEEENLKCDYKIGDMLELPYKDNSFDCILCRNVISHTDTLGIKKIIKEIKRVLKENGECYLTLGSKNTWGFKQEDWPLVDPNTRLRMEEGPEYKTPHFYADYDLCMELFKDFKIIKIYQVNDYYGTDEKRFESYHFHLLIKKESK